MIEILKAHGINHISDVRNATSHPTSTVCMHVVSLNGQADIDILPDTGADICAAGPDFVKAVGEHLGNLADSDIVPKTANGQKMKPLGKLPAVRFTLQDKSTVEDVHIYQSVSGALISWSTAQDLGILPDHYPQPISARPTAINALVSASPSKVGWTLSIIYAVRWVHRHTGCRRESGDKARAGG